MIEKFIEDISFPPFIRDIWALLGATVMFLTSPITNVSTRGWPAYAGGKTFATNGDQGKEMAQVAEHKNLGSSSFQNKKKEL